MLADLWREPGVERLLLDGLDEEGVVEFVERAHGHALDEVGEALARALHARTAGNPFFVGEFLRHLDESGAVYQKAGDWSYYEDAEGLGMPEGVRDVVARRLGRLSDDANRVLTFASVVGLEFDLQLMERLVESAAVDATLDALDEAVAARVIGELGSGRYRFAHALVRDTIYSGVTVTRRARLHHRVGDALAALPGDQAHAFQPSSITTPRRRPTAPPPRRVTTPSPRPARRIASHRGRTRSRSPSGA